MGVGLGVEVGVAVAVAVALGVAVAVAVGVVVSVAVGVGLAVSVGMGVGAMWTGSEMIVWGGIYQFDKQAFHYRSTLRCEFGMTIPVLTALTCRTRIDRQLYRSLRAVKVLLAALCST